MLVWWLRCSSRLRGEAGERQIADPEYGIAHNVGATGATVTVQVYRR